MSGIAGIGYRDAVAALTGGIPAVGGIATACDITDLATGITVSGGYLIYKDLTVIITFTICAAYLIGFVAGYIRVIITLTPKTTGYCPLIRRQCGGGVRFTWANKAKAGIAPRTAATNLTALLTVVNRLKPVSEAK